MKNKFLLSKIFATFFSITTILILILTQERGKFIDMVGSNEAALNVYFVNTALLFISLIFYTWQRAMHNRPSHSKLDTLNMIDVMDSDKESGLIDVKVSKTIFSSIADSDDKVVSVKTQKAFSILKNNDQINLINTNSPNQTLKLRVIDIDSTHAVFEKNS